MRQGNKGEEIERLRKVKWCCGWWCCFGWENMQLKCVIDVCGWCVDCVCVLEFCVDVCVECVVG